MYLEYNIYHKGMHQFKITRQAARFLICRFHATNCAAVCRTADRVTVTDVAVAVRRLGRYGVKGSRTADIQTLLMQLEYLGAGGTGCWPF
jgi:hypothetical protein